MKFIARVEFVKGDFLADGGEIVIRRKGIVFSVR